MIASPINLETSWYEKVSVELNQDLKSLEELSFRPKSSVYWTHNPENIRSWAIRLEVKVDPQEGAPSPYRVDVAVVGMFLVDESVPVEKIEHIVVVNGSSVLFSGVREIVRGITQRSAVDGFTLPIVSFVDLSEKPPTTLVRTTLIQEGPLSVPGISRVLGCSKEFAQRQIDVLVDAGEVRKKGRKYELVGDTE